VTGDPNDLTASTLCLPAGVLTDSNGNLYVADSGFNAIIEIQPTAATNDCF